VTISCRDAEAGVRLHEKDCKEHEVSCHHNLEEYLDQYIATAGISADPDGPLFRTTGQKTGMVCARAISRIMGS
jgi:hypothetical protein